MTNSIGEKGKQSLWSLDPRVWHQKKGNHHGSHRGVTNDSTGVRAKSVGQVEGLDQVGDITEMESTGLGPNRLQLEEKKGESKKAASLGSGLVPGWGVGPLTSGMSAGERRVVCGRCEEAGAREKAWRDILGPERVGRKS